MRSTAKREKSKTVQGGKLRPSASTERKRKIQGADPYRQATPPRIASELPYRNLFGNMLNGIAYCKMLFAGGRPVDFIYLDVNSAFESLTGLKDVVGKKVSKVIPGIRESDPKLFEVYGRVSLTGQPERFETYVEVLKMWFLISVYSPGKEYFVAVFDVITERRQAEEALRESEEKYRNVVERANDGIAIIQDAILKYVNPRLAELWGGAVDELIGRPFADFIHPDELPVVLDRYQRRMAGEDVTPTYETAFKRKDGSKAYTELNAGTITFHGAPADLAIVRDITQRKRGEQALRESEGHFHSLFDNATIGMYRTTPDGRILLSNPAGVQMLGYASFEEMAHRNLETDGSDADYPRSQFRDRMQNEGSVIGLEGAWKRKDGTTIFVRESATAVRDAQGNVLYYDGTFEDITGRKQAEDALRRRAEELAALQATLLEITASRDLNTLLHTIVGRAAQLLETRSGGLYLCDPGHREVRLVVSYNTPRDYAGTILKYGEGAAGTVAETREPLIIDDYRVWNKRAAAYEQEQPFTSVLSAPMLWHGQVTGVIDLLDDVESRHFAESDLELLKLFANHAAIAVENVRLYEQAQNEITERKQAEQLLRQAEANYRHIVENSPVGIYQTTPQGRPLTVNQALAHIVGYDSPREVLDATDNVEAQFYLDPASRREFQRLIEDQGYVREFSSQARRKDGEIIWVQESARVVRDAEGNTLYYEGFVTDITERKQADEELRRLSAHDSLTGLYNHGFFIAEMARLERGREFPVSILMADVDHLKNTNDVAGHAAGDVLLKRVAQVLTAAFRVEDVVARIGGDEFAALLPGTDAPSAEVAVQRVRRVVQENNAANAETPIRLSLGVSTAESRAPLSVVLKEADSNMYVEKRGHVAS